MGNWISEITKNDCTVVTEGLYEDLGILVHISGCYEPWEKRGVFVCSMHLVIIVLFVVTVGVEQGLTSALTTDNIVIFVQAVHISLLMVCSLLILRAFTVHRSSLNEMHFMLGNDYKYDDLGDLNYNKLTQRSKKIKLIMKYAIPSYLALGGSLVVLVTPISNYLLAHQKTHDIDDVDQGLILPSWTIHNTDTVVLKWTAILRQLVCAIFAVPILTTGILMFLSMNESLVLQLKVLLFCIENLEQRAINRFHERYQQRRYKKISSYYLDMDFHDCYYESWVMIVKHHLFIIRYSRELQQIASYPVFFIVVVSQLMIALGIYSAMISTNNPVFVVQQTILTGAEIMSVGLACWYGEEITLMSNDLGGNVFSKTSWYNCDEKVKKSMRIMRSGVQGIQIKTIDTAVTYVLNLQTFSDILNASYSFINLIRAAKITEN